MIVQDGIFFLVVSFILSEYGVLASLEHDVIGLCYYPSLVCLVWLLKVYMVCFPWPRDK